MNMKNEFLVKNLFLIIIIGLGLNSAFNSFAAALGASWPYTTFLFNPNDLFADYFKLIYSYAHLEDFSIGEPSSLLRSYTIDNSYSIVFSQGKLTNYHLTPLSTLYSLINLKLMHYISPRILFISNLFIVMFLSSYLIKIFVKLNRDAILLMLALFLSYPFLLFFSRGNIQSGFTALFITVYLLNCFKKRNVYSGLIFLALAVNLRPNAIIFIFALIINLVQHKGDWQSKASSLIKPFLYFFTLTFLIFLLSLKISGHFYQGYTLSNFLHGVKIYHQVYVVDNLGLAYSSSMLSLIKVITNYAVWKETAVIILGSLLFLISTRSLFLEKISDVSYLFVLCGIYALCTSVFGDYHLMIFFAPLLILYDKNRSCVPKDFDSHNRKEYLLIFFVSSFLLIPKNFIFINGISLQVILNPLVLFGAILYLNISGNLKLDRIYQSISNIISNYKAH